MTEEIVICSTKDNTDAKDFKVLEDVTKQIFEQFVENSMASPKAIAVQAEAIKRRINHFWELSFNCSLIRTQVN